MESLIEVCVSIPLKRQAEFYVWFGRWLGGSNHEEFVQEAVISVASANHTLDEPVGIRRERTNTWTTGTAEEQLRDARRMYRHLSPMARDFLNHLLDHAEGRMTAKALANAMNTSIHGVAGSLASFRIQSHAVRRDIPFDWIPGYEGATEYLLPTEVADLFRRARG